jgi:hypothetical protein
MDSSVWFRAHNTPANMTDYLQPTPVQAAEDGSHE